MSNIVKRDMNTSFKIATSIVVALCCMSANAAEFQLDVSSILQAITVIIAAVTSIGLAALSVHVVIAAFRKIKAAL